MFGVIICPRCNRARGVDLSVKTSKCPGCGVHSEVDRLRVYFQTDNELELAEAVRRTSSRMQQSIEDYDDGVILARQATEEQRKKARNQSLDFDGMVILANSLSSETGFSLDDLKDALVKEGYDLDPAKIASVMLNEGIIYEPRPGRFRPL
ncbi:MAG TPA: hypothetical protein VGK23_02145 [Methanomassiliicoccales archaeon]|jgi:hypothetical protein